MEDGSMINMIWFIKLVKILRSWQVKKEGLVCITLKMRVFIVTWLPIFCLSDDNNEAHGWNQQTADKKSNRSRHKNGWFESGGSHQRRRKLRQRVSSVLPGSQWSLISSTTVCVCEFLYWDLRVCSSSTRFSFSINEKLSGKSSVSCYISLRLWFCSSIATLFSMDFAQWFCVFEKQG